MSTVTAFFTHVLGPDAALIPKTEEIAEQYHEVLIANRERLARWEPWAREELTPQSTREFIGLEGRDWLAGGRLPVVLAVAAPEGRWEPAGSLSLRINQELASGELGYWIAEQYEGRGLVRRAAEVMLDQAFGPFGLGRVQLSIEVGNARSRGLAERLGFTQEGVIRQSIVFPEERRDKVVYGMLPEEWRARRG
ncbi:GNAT family N-acetyltransferase [Kitasatospora sp. NBC_01287]|uniref:GNAT family N-acetyltransferase n=1 Tax=Kitasatospora sp. NBC_01287 TaxID=2903573 RepID=UPI002258B2D4|nr:GNAT family protein [Kitasatospora sp. NBC_01287]MCX4746873.1 GNAT family N-acetyltransferase [Kitasatospora sp. NBC_01287]